MVAPQVKSYQYTNVTYQVTDLELNCKLSDGTSCNEKIQETYNWYREISFFNGEPVKYNKQKEIKKLNVIMQTQEYPVNFYLANESYSINFEDNTIQIDCYDPFGFVRAFSVLTQLIINDNYDKGHYKIEGVSIIDEPLYKYRGVMIDSSRHFLPLSAMKRQINALSLSRMNVLHVHSHDSQSFPLKTDTEPGSKLYLGSWTTGGQRYYHTLEQFSELAHYAVVRGIFIVFEFDQPGHSASMFQGCPECVCNNHDVINPANEKLYQVIETYLTDVYNTIYKPYNMSPMFHFGGDEVQMSSFSNTPSCSSFMKAHEYDNRGIWKYFHQRVTDIVEKIAQSAPKVEPSNFRLYWQESYGNGNNFSDGGVVHVWMSSGVISQAANNQVFVIRGQGWYLDLNQPGGNFEAFVDSWRDFYRVDPAERVSTQNLKYVLGGSTQQWGEKVHDGNIDEQIWPRSAAVGEVLWGVKQQNLEEVAERLQSLTCKFRQAGVHTGSIIEGVPCPGVDKRSDEKIIPNYRHQVETQQEDEGWGGR